MSKNNTTLNNKHIISALQDGFIRLHTCCGEITATIKTDDLADDLFFTPPEVENMTLREYRKAYSEESIADQILSCLLAFESSKDTDLCNQADAWRLILITRYAKEQHTDKQDNIEQGMG